MTAQEAWSVEVDSQDTPVFLPSLCRHVLFWWFEEENLLRGTLLWFLLQGFSSSPCLFERLGCLVFGSVSSGFCSGEALNLHFFLLKLKAVLLVLL